MSEPPTVDIRTSVDAVFRAEAGRILEARDLNHTVELISKHPGVKFGPWETRPAADLGEIVRQSEARRRQPGKPQR